MNVPNYTGNSNREKANAKDKKVVPQVLETPPVRKPPGRIERFAKLFIAGNFGEVRTSVFADIVVPSLKDLLFDSLNEAARGYLYGDTRRTTRSRAHPHYREFTDYSRPSRVGPRADNPGRRTSIDRATHDFSNLIFGSSGEAEAAIDALTRLIEQYGAATVADFYETVGLTSDFPDHTYGWTDIRGSGIHRVREGYILRLPKTIQLDTK